MPNRNSGTIYQRGSIWWVKIRVNGRPHYESSRSTKKTDAIKLRDRLLAQRHRGELSGGAPDKVLINELLDDFLRSDIKPETKYIWERVIEANLRPYFGTVKAHGLTTDKMDAYRAFRRAKGRADSTVNRELSILRMAFRNGRKRTPPKVNAVPYFPMLTEKNIRKGFLTDDQYAVLRDVLLPELKPLFVCGYLTGMRKGELCAITWPQVDFESGFITLEKDKTKGNEARTVPILESDMLDLLTAAKQERDADWPHSPWVFNRHGEPIKDFRWSWKVACKAAGVPALQFHDLRRTAVRNMRRAGVPQVIRMKISGHKTDSMERRYNIVDGEDLSIAKTLMEQRMRAAQSVTATVTTSRNTAIPDDSDTPEV
jgi:integrase